MTLLLLLAVATERETERIEECLALCIGGCRGHERDVHAAGDVDLVVVDLREDRLLGDAERVVAAPVELHGQTAEVADSRDRQRDEPVEELPHAVAAQGDLGTDAVALTQLEAG